MHKSSTILYSKERNDMNKKYTTVALVLNIITCAFYIAFLAMSIIDKSWAYAIIALILIVCHMGLVREIRKKAKSV